MKTVGFRGPQGPPAFPLILGEPRAGDIGVSDFRGLPWLSPFSRHFPMCANFKTVPDEDAAARKAEGPRHHASRPSRRERGAEARYTQPSRALGSRLPTGDCGALSGWRHLYLKLRKRHIHH